MKGRQFSQEVAFLVKNDKKNVINLGESSESNIDYDQYTKTQKNLSVNLKGKNLRTFRDILGLDYFSHLNRPKEMELIKDGEKHKPE